MERRIRSAGEPGEPFDRGACELILHENGGVELLDPRGGQRWHSDSDEEFRDEFPDFIQESDVPAVLDYLEAADLLTEDEAERCEITELSFTDEDDEGAGDEGAQDEDGEDDEYGDE
jgi:hypothetical protein